MEFYEPGDLLNVWPLPVASLCEAFLSRLELDGDTLIQVRSGKGKVSPRSSCELINKLYT
jgi:sulfite reductase alpha subunit-like flavoprotein